MQQTIELIQKCIIIEMNKSDSYRAAKTSQFYVTYIYFLFTLFGNGAYDESLIDELIENKIILEEAKIFFSSFDESVKKILLSLKRKEWEYCQELYQYLLNSDVTFDGERYSYTSNLTERKLLGSFYTPQDLAYYCVKETIDKAKFNKKEICSKKIADYSCGGGEFFNALYKVLVEVYGFDDDELKLIGENLIGYDVDPIACLLSKYLISNRFGICYEKINITLGNPLIHGNGNSYVPYSIYSKNNGCFNHLEKADIIIGNPPWEKIRFERKSEFHKNLYSDEKIVEFLNEKEQDYFEAKKDIINNKNYEFFSDGELNTCNLFLKCFIDNLHLNGYIGVLLKSSVLCNSINKRLVEYLYDNNLLFLVAFYTNKNKIFDIDSREKFIFLILHKKNDKTFFAKFNCINTYDVYSKQELLINYSDIALLNPNTKTLPNLLDVTHYKLNLKISKMKKFSDEYNVKYGRLVHYTTHKDFISKSKNDFNIPVYEGKFIHLYNIRYSTYKNMSYDEKYKNKAVSKLISNSDYPESRYFISKEKWNEISKSYVEKYMLCWRSLSSNTNTNAMISALMPFGPASQSIQFLQTNKKDMIILNALFNSNVFNFIIRQKLVTLDITQKIISQIPVPSHEQYLRKIEVNKKNISIEDYIISLVAQIYSDEPKNNELFEDIVPLDYDKEKCKKLINEMFYQLYGLNADEIEIIKKASK